LTELRTVIIHSLTFHWQVPVLLSRGLLAAVIFMLLLRQGQDVGNRSSIQSSNDPIDLLLGARSTIKDHLVVNPPRACDMHTAHGCNQPQRKTPHHHLEHKCCTVLVHVCMQPSFHMDKVTACCSNARGAHAIHISSLLPS
jgi:hypothetical protein